MEFLNDYTMPIIVGICLCVGYIIKQWLNDIDNKYIPTALAILGTVLSVWIYKSVSPESILCGLISGLASTGTHQSFKQFIENKDRW